MALTSKHKVYLLGYDIGSSSVKAALIDAETGLPVAIVQSPHDTMPISSPYPGWAEQDPEMWWSHVCLATRELLSKASVDPHEIKGIGIAYQMHGLVCVDKDRKVLRPAIIWCDSRAVHIGDNAYDIIGHETCLNHLLNSPGNFTASKLRWVKEYEPEVFQRIDKIMLPGDYIAMKLTGEVVMTPEGLSEGMMWDFRKEDIAEFLFDHYGFDLGLIPGITPVFSMQGQLHDRSAKETGLVAGIPVTYRAGDQPNNAMSLGVLQAGEIAASGGTSGVVYGVVDTLTSDVQSRVNSFMHVNHTLQDPRIGILLCINGAGSQYNWIKQEIAHPGMSYEHMEKEASTIPVGADGLRIMPFGNGAERMLGNHQIGAHILHLDFSRHTRAHLYRAALEGIAFAFVYGMHIMRDMGLRTDVIKVGNDNLFRSAVFSSTISTLMDVRIEVIETTGAVGAAKAAGVSIGLYPFLEDAFQHLPIRNIFEPNENKQKYADAFHSWRNELQKMMRTQ